MHRIAFAIVSVLLPFSFAACGGEESAPASSVGSYSGEDGLFSAEVEDDTITIHIVGDGDSKSLYWVGTWANGEELVVSHADQDQLDRSLLGSTSDTKEFSVSGETITFEFSMMGTTKAAQLEKS